MTFTLADPAGMENSTAGMTIDQYTGQGATVHCVPLDGGLVLDIDTDPVTRQSMAAFLIRTTMP